MHTNMRWVIPLLVLCGLWMPVSVWATSAPNATTNTNSATCGTASALQKAKNQYDQNTQAIIDYGSPNLQPLAAQACLKNLLQFGYSLGLSTLSVSSVMQDLISRVCSAAINLKSSLIGQMNQAVGNNTTTNGYFNVNANVNGTGYKGSNYYSIGNQAASSIWNALN